MAIYLYSNQFNKHMLNYINSICQLLGCKDIDNTKVDGFGKSGRDKVSNSSLQKLLQNTLEGDLIYVEFQCFKYHIQVLYKIAAASNNVLGCFKSVILPRNT